MITSKNCSTCGSEVAPGQACGKCLLGIGLGESSLGSAVTAELTGDAGISAADWILRANSVFVGYRLLSLEGEGGMGAVYRAEQEHPRRVVALKVIKPGRSSAELLRRFERESELLARLQHPGIAQVYAAGTADTGSGPQPYFAMEFIRGQSLIDYAESRQLGTNERLLMMTKICDAVQHAHQRGIIHRDLKPSNILVDDEGQPKILDFGVARVTDSDAYATRQTDVGQLIGTLAYMSPEQVSADPHELDTRTDVYSLGVILYELLSGRMPYRTTGLLHDIIATVRDVEPTALSGINKTYGGDIETIVGKALEKDKTRRYASAADFANDIRRYLADEPITAKPASAAYQIQKFAKRHRPLVAGIAIAFAALVAGGVTSTWQAVRAGRAESVALQQRDRATAAQQETARERDRALNAERVTSEQRDRAIAAEKQAIAQRNLAVSERRRADQEAASSKAVNDFLQNDLMAQASVDKQGGPQNKPDPDLKVRTALDRAAATIKDRFGKQPLVEASIRMTIFEAYRQLGLLPEAQIHAQRAFDLRQQLLGDEHLDTIASLETLAILSNQRSDYAKAATLHQTILNSRRRLLGAEHPDTLDGMNGLAVVLGNQGKQKEAERLLTSLVPVSRRVRGIDDPKTLESMDNLASVYQSQFKYAQAEELGRQVLEAQIRKLGPEHPSTLLTRNTLAVTLTSQGKVEGAGALWKESLAIQKRLLGEDHPNTLMSATNFASNLESRGLYAEAEPLMLKSLEASRRVRGENQLNTLVQTWNLASLYDSMDQPAKAEPLFLQVVERTQRSIGDQHPLTLASLRSLASFYVASGKLPQAKSAIDSAMEVHRRAVGETHPFTWQLAGIQADWLSRMGRADESERGFTAVLGALSEKPGKGHPVYLAGLERLANARAARGDYPGAHPLYVSLLETKTRSLGETHPSMLRMLARLGGVLFLAGSYTKSEPFLRQAVAGCDKTNNSSWTRSYAMTLLGASLVAQGRLTEAEPILQGGYADLIAPGLSIPPDRRADLAKAIRTVVESYQRAGESQKATQWRERAK